MNRFQRLATDGYVAAIGALCALLIDPWWKSLVAAVSIIVGVGLLALAWVYVTSNGESANG